MHFSTLIQNWYRQNKRDLPWRFSNDPYLIWLSEVILQQTRVEQGLPYYLKFSKRFSTVKKLATAQEDEILNLWQGLGYYSRARNMHAAAKQIVTEYKGEFPDDYNKIRALKGVGDYTAAAIASFAFNQPHAVVDGNVYRVLSRVYKEPTPIDSSEGKKIFSQLANQILDKKNPAQHNQAIMELGALVCSPKSPSCSMCPVQIKCLSFADDSFLNYPVKKKKLVVRQRFFNYGLVTDGKKIVLKKRGDGDIWNGLYDFRLIENLKDSSEVPDKFNDLEKVSIKLDGTFTHLLSHQKISAKFWMVKVKKIKLNKGEILVDISNLYDYPMPQLLIRYLNESSLLYAL